MDVRRLPSFDRWLSALADRTAVSRIAARLTRLERGHFGDHSSVGDGVSELRVDHGPGYRIYFTVRNRAVVVLLCGGDKSSQTRDVRRAKDLAASIQG